MQRMRKWVFILTLLAMSLGRWHGGITVGFAQEGDTTEKLPPLKIVTTTSMLADALRQVGGTEVVVRALMGPGIDPHGYRQTRSDVVQLTRADLVVWHGLSLEAQMEELMATLARKKPVVALAELLPKDRLLAHPDYPGKYDPHIWMNPRLWREIVGEACKVLTHLRPEAADYFAKNKRLYEEELQILDRYAASVLESIPKPARVLVSAHDAFSYFGRAYGIEVVGLQGISTQSEVGLHHLSKVVDLLVERNIRAVFVESSVSDQTMRALIEGAAAKGHRVSIGAELFSDAMGSEGSYEGTYIGMIDHNITFITHALGGVAPLRGMQGALNTSTPERKRVGIRLE